MKVTVITGPKGELIATQLGHPGKGAGLRAGQGQKVHELSIPDAVADIKDPREFHQAMLQHLPKS
jgi:hypothetical protein